MDPTTTATPGSSSTAFVGREREIAYLEAGLDDALQGRSRLFLIAGEPGIGKSRLADELATLAQARGCLVLWGRCWEAGGAPAYWPWVQSLRAHVRDADPDALRQQVGNQAEAGDLAQLLPELRDLFPDLPPPPSVNPETARFRLFDAAASFIRAIAEHRPIVLVLDDLHAADAPSLLLLRFVARELADARVLILATYRDAELARDRALAAAISELSREPGTRPMLLVGLTEDQVARYIEATARISPTRALALGVHGETEGNPLFVGELIRLLDAEGRLTQATTEAAWRLAIPQGLDEVIGRRLGHLSEACVEALTLASVFGREFRVAALQEVSDLDADALLEVLDEATAARVVLDAPGAVGVLRFSHQLIRDALYDGLPAARRLKLHRQAGEALEALYAQNPEPYLAELSHHFVHAGSAGDPDRAVRYSRLAADRALRLLAYEEAAHLYGTALQVLDTNPATGTDPATRCDLLLALGDALASVGDTPRAKETFLEAARISKAEAMPERLARAALGYGGRFVWEASREDPQLPVLLQDALAAQPDQDSSLRVRLMARLGGGPWRDQPDRAPRDRLTNDAVAMARRLGDPHTLAYALDGRYGAVWWPENLEERLALATELIEVAERAGDRERQQQGHHFLCFANLERGDLGGTLAELDAQQALAEELKQPAWLLYVTTCQATMATLQGKFDEAERLGEEAFSLGRRAEASMTDIYRTLGLFNLRRHQGRLAEVEEPLARAVSRFPTYFALPCALSVVHVELGRDGQARAALEELSADDFAAIARNDEWLYAVALLADVAASLEGEVAVETTYRTLLPYADRVAVSPPDGCTGAVARNLGVLATVLGRWDEAAGHFETALDINRRLEARPWVVKTQEEFASTLVRRDGAGDRDHAIGLLAEALATHRELGLPARAQSVAGRLRGLGIEPDRGVRSTKTFVFTDIVGSTSLLEAIGDEAWESLVRWHDRTLRSVFAGHGGQEVDHAGDGFLVVFDMPEPALRCAVAIQRALAEHRRTSGFAPRVRIGVHRGEATMVGGKFAGRAVHEAARIASLADGEGIVASWETAASLPGLEFTDPRSVRVKGLAEPIDVVTVSWRTDAVAPDG